MVFTPWPVDGISVCSASGVFRPLRLRLEDEKREILRMDVEEILSVQEIPYVGAETAVFLCRSTVWGEQWLFELRYHFRNHKWHIQKRMG